MFLNGNNLAISLGCLYWFGKLLLMLCPLLNFSSYEWIILKGIIFLLSYPSLPVVHTTTTIIV